MTQRIQIAIRGAVQGVGFRPFIYRLATGMGLFGWVLNSSRGVFIEAEGSPDQLNAFLLRIEKEKPPRSFIQSLESSFRDAVGFDRFEIRESDRAGEPTALVLPDIAVCPDCLTDVYDPSNRRHLYPFTNCTNCGPRFSIIESLPYDRAHTTMKRFEMCGSCRREYENPLDRRFHAQPNACPSCGPRLELWDESGECLYESHDALTGAAAAIRAGQIVAVKGLGGFHLMADAGNEAAVVRLRERKHREEKPFALMVPSAESVRFEVRISDLEARLLRSPEAPIVLLDRRSGAAEFMSRIAPSVAPGNPTLGLMLPYTPMHHILLRELGRPVVATSGNGANEPICIDEYEAVRRLRGIADLFLVHNRTILRPLDDSVARVMLGREQVLRRARGFAPLPVHFGEPGSGDPDPAVPSILAVGAHLKNTVALTAGRNIFISQHIGDLETAEAFEAFRKVVDDYRALYRLQPGPIACDLHPDYFSTRYARDQGMPLIRVQHHYAHVASCMAENELEDPVLGVSWDGTGYGPDGTIWGGEFLLTDGAGYRRVGSFRTFRLPGGELAVKEPRRSAAGLLYEILGSRFLDRADLPPIRSFSSSERTVIRQMLSGELNSPATSSVGRLFDAVASILGLRQRTGFEGQAAMELEFAIRTDRTDEAYPYQISDLNVQMDGCLILDWEPLIRGLLEDLGRGGSVGMISARFHNTLAQCIVEVARRVGEERVVLTGGCFQNRYLTEKSVERLRAAGFRPYWHQRIPPNDGGIALGQASVALREIKAKRTPLAGAGVK